jgi:hypothetical protein
MAMVASNGNYLKAPVFSDEEQNRKANMLQLSSISLLFGSIVGIMIFIISNSFNLILVFSFMLIGAFISLLLLRFGHLFFASWTMLICLLVSLMLVMYIANGIHDTITLLFPISIVIASMLFERRNLIAYSLIAYLSLQVFGVCELAGIINNPMSQFTTLEDVISVGILMFIPIVLTYKMSESLRHSFHKVNQSNDSLTESNLKLQYGMKERSKLENELKTKVSELERFKIATIDRELRMIELKNELAALKAKILGVGAIAD